MEQQLTSKDFFFCYSPHLASYIIDKGFNTITVAKNNQTGKTFSLFTKSDGLQEVINTYKNNKQ